MDLSKQQRLIIFTVAGALLVGLIILGIKNVTKTELDVFPVEESKEDAAALASDELPQASTLEFFVHVCGEVKNPGVYRLKQGARRFEAVDAAGGVTEEADASAVNLAAVIADGEQIYVPKKGMGTFVSHKGKAPKGKNGAKVQFPLDINRATAAELEAVPGIGPSMAEAIVGFRKEHGAFAAVDQLTELPGVGEKKLERLKPYLCVR